MYTLKDHMSNYSLETSLTLWQKIYILWTNHDIDWLISSKTFIYTCKTAS